MCFKYMNTGLGMQGDIFFPSREHNCFADTLQPIFKNLRLLFIFLYLICYAGHSCHLIKIASCPGPPRFAEITRVARLVEVYWGAGGKDVCSCSSLLSIIIYLIKFMT